MKYGKDVELLPSLAVKLRLKSTLEFEKVQRQLGHLSRVAIDTRADHNSAICAVILQLKLPKNVKSDIIRHQVAAHMVEEYLFYLPKMEHYLKQNRLSFSSYIVNLYNGNIWSDEFMLGALAKMFDIKISVVSPSYDDVWKVFHESALPHVVLVSNGGDFGHKQGVTHFSTTKGIEQSWKCVGADLSVGEMGKWSGYEKGLAYPMDKFHEKKSSCSWIPLETCQLTFNNCAGT